jgi:hypothetical protein
MKSNKNDEPTSNPGQGTLTSGEPDAVKVARPVRRGECGDVPLETPGYTERPSGESAPAKSQVTRHAPTLHSDIQSLPAVRAFI